MTEELCKICEEGEVVYNDLCTDCLAKALSGAQKPQVTTQEATRVLLFEQKERVRAAEKELEAMCVKHRVTLDVFMIVRAAAVARAQFVPQEGWAGDPNDPAAA